MSRSQSWVYGVKSQKVDIASPPQRREAKQNEDRQKIDAAYSTEDTYLLEVFEVHLTQMKEYFLKMKNRNDWLILERFFEHNFR